MTDKLSCRRMAWAAWLTAPVGPIAVYLAQDPHAHWVQDLLEKDLLAGMWALAALGGLGAGVGVLAVAKGARLAGAACILTNSLVLAYFGFIAWFFSMGYSR